MTIWVFVLLSVLSTILSYLGKDLSKADVSVNIYAFLKAQKTGKPVELCCAIGDDTIDGKPYSEIVEIAREYIDSVGGFEKFAEWGLY
jgi:S-adenosylmethionine synthetase